MTPTMLDFFQQPLRLLYRRGRHGPRAGPDPATALERLAAELSRGGASVETGEETAPIRVGLAAPVGVGDGVDSQSRLVGFELRLIWHQIDELERHTREWSKQTRA